MLGTIRPTRRGRCPQGPTGHYPRCFVGPDEDDIDEPTPLPDPTMRTWRHPSELAAVAAMAAREETERRRRRFTLGAVLFSGGLGATLALLTVGTVGLLRSEPEPARFQLRTASTTERPVSTTTADDRPAEASTTTEPPATTVPTTSTTRPPLQPVDRSLVAAATPAPPAGAIAAVLLGDGREQCTGIVVDGHLVTSASALGDVVTATVVIGGRSYQATVVGKDRFTDIAVLDVDAEAPLATIPPASALDVDAAVALVAVDDQPDPITVVGRVHRIDEIATASDGHALIGLVVTTARLPQTGAGAPLLTADGSLAGMVVDTPGHLAVAVTEPVLRQVVRSLLSTGHAVPVWVGITALETADGVELRAVEDGGPADRAGLRIGDVVRNVDGREITRLGELIAAIRAGQPGDALSLTLERRSRPLRLELLIGTHADRSPDEQAASGG
jgi:S1-C subfamily serine protease